ncbi:hypothetical protein BH23CHL2_BH23CHL2_26510 [soil metagenome]
MMSRIRTPLLLIILTALVVLAACSSPESSPSGLGPDSTPVPATQSEASPTASDPLPTTTLEPPVFTATVLPPAATPAEDQPADATPTPTSEPAPTATAQPVNTATPAPGPSDVWNLRQFEIDEPIMVLTFDAGADRGYAAEILDILAQEGIPASFGMTGPWAEDNPDLMLRIVNEGHHLINHSWSHPHFPELTSDERIAEVRSLEDLLRNEYGVELQPYFRPPFGEYDEATLTDLAAMGYTINVLWTVDTLGWKGLTADEINERVMDTAAPGGIVLMHVGAQSQDAAALPEMIRLLREQGYSFATIQELAGQ